MKKIIPCAIVLFSFVACNSHQPDQDPSLKVPQKAVTTMDSSNIGQQASTANPAIVATPATTPGAVPQTKISAATAADLAKSGGLNPAHGQPNHRCDIPVGAPLSTPVQQTAAAPQMQQINGTQQTIAAPATVPNGSTAKLNPPHGQPGHDCKIPVGQPLN